jgi:anti-sigma factor RsiW
VSFKRKRIPHELIIRDAKWEQPYERNRWLLWSIAALLFAGVLSFMIILSMFPGMSDDGSIVVRPTDVNFESAEQFADGIKGETRIVLPIKTDVLEVPVSDE